MRKGKNYKTILFEISIKETRKKSNQELKLNHAFDSFFKIYVGKLYTSKLKKKVNT